MQECPKCKSKKWLKNPITELMFCQVCGYVIGDLKGDEFEHEGKINRNR